MALLATQQMTDSGAAISYSAVAASDTVDCSNGRTFLHVKNGGGSPDTVTLVTPGTVSGLAIADRTISVPAGAERLIGPLDPGLYGAIATVQHSFITSVTAAAVTI